MSKKAVALKYDKKVSKAPKILAKGEGESAKNIIKIAQENNLSIQKDENLVELLSKVELNKEVPENLYKSVAEIFSFIYKITKK